ncbi:hypothetical protein V1291_003574 [Nitrobacteraceae bacterium AZCC 1564]
MRTPRRLVCATLIVIANIGSGAADAKSPRVVTIMSYNAENLFDTSDNPNNIVGSFEIFAQFIAACFVRSAGSMPRA